MHLCSVSGNIAAQYVSTYLQLSLQFPFKITRCVIPPFRFSAYFLRDGLRSFSKIKSDSAILVQVETKSKRALLMKFFCFLWMLSVWEIRVSYKTNRYLDQLGMASTYDTKTYCRQSLIGGNYGLLNTTTFVPNPDYYRLFNFEVFTFDRPEKLCFVALLAIAFSFAWWLYDFHVLDHLRFLSFVSAENPGEIALWFYVWRKIRFFRILENCSCSKWNADCLWPCFVFVSYNTKKKKERRKTKLEKWIV